jgi:hypothetical protein
MTGKSRESVRCLINVGESIWCGVANRVYVIDAHTLEVRVCFYFFLVIELNKFILSIRNNLMFILNQNIQFNI